MGIIDKAPDLFEIITDVNSLRKIVDDGNVVITYMTDWCGPCRRTIHEFYFSKESIKEELAKRSLKMAYVDPDSIVPLHDARVIPSYHAHGINGSVVGTFAGKISPNDFIELLNNWYGPLKAQP